MNEQPNIEWTKVHVPRVSGLFPRRHKMNCDCHISDVQRISLLEADVAFHSAHVDGNIHRQQLHIRKLQKKKWFQIKYSD